MPHATNLKGEQGGVTLTDGESFTPAAQKDYATGFHVILDGTILTSIASNYAGDDTKMIGTALPPGFYPGIITELTVTTGLVRVNDGSRA